MRSLRTLIVPALALALLAPAPAAAQSTDRAAGEIVVYLVRHAERAEDGTRDPRISLPGWDRARLLADVLRDAGLTHIHTTDYRRTRSTARPTADRTGLTPEVYDPRDLAAFAARLRRTPGRHLVVGHSDTTTALVRALGGDSASPIGELEYDRLYVLTMSEGGVGTVLLRIGAGGPP
jgi:broad specificity phosphatase PhoE